MTGEGDPRALHWYDFICPFCYVGQSRTTILERRGLAVAELPFHVHPEIPAGGVAAGPRLGPMYVMIEQEARGAGLALHWPQHLPDTSRALAAAEWARLNQPQQSRIFRRRLFAAHFELGEDLEDQAVIDRHADQSDIALSGLKVALADGSAAAAVREAELIGRRHGVRGTPAWLVGGRLISGLRPVAEFERLAL
jgi:predicted DsbA family dithiol-disulfide isomerase